MAIRAVLLDCWGTLITYAVAPSPFVGEKFLTFCDNPSGLTPEQIESSWSSLMKYYHGREGEFESPVDALVRALCIRCNLKPRISIDKLVDSTIGAQYRQTMVEGVDRALRALTEKGVPYAVGSNSIYSSKQTQGYISQVMPTENFKFIVASSDLAAKKPSPLFFEMLSKLIGVPEKECCYVGDTFTPDIYGSYMAGYGLSIWLNPENKDPLSDGVQFESVKNWDEALKVIERHL